ncbi:DoxX family protein [Flavobacteriales bacterium]|nr:DoxX family protein [Flavobacteriales bacterium]
MNITKQPYFSDTILLIVRLSIAALMLTHGLPKLSKLMAGGEIKFANPIGLGPTISLILVVFSELFCSILIAVGYKTRLATIPLIITMLVAAFIMHYGDGIHKQEKALLYVIVYLTILVSDGGKISLDYHFKNKHYSD